MTIQALIVAAACILLVFLLYKGINALERRSAERDRKRLEAELKKTADGIPGKPERTFLKSCTNCKTFGLTLPFRDALGRTYCSATCMKWMGEGRANRVFAPSDEPGAAPALFCERCTSETMEKSLGNLFTMNGVGAGLYGSSQRCPDCDSVIRRVCFCVFFIPVIPLGRYRVIHPSPNQFFSRKVV